MHQEVVFDDLFATHQPTLQANGGVGRVARRGFPGEFVEEGHGQTSYA